MPAPFELLPEQKKEFKNRQEDYTRKLSQIVKDKQLVRLNSDYFSTNYYYWSPSTHQMYVVDYMGGFDDSNQEPQFTISHDPHILQFNHLEDQK